MNQANQPVITHPVMRPFFVGFSLLFTACLLHAQDAPKFRTDADGPASAKASKAKPAKGKEVTLEWHQLVEGQFPPEGSAHAIAGELIRSDHLERRFQIRVDRDDSQERGVWDLPVDATLLPYGAIYYHGAPAALQDIPLGTHLRGLFYLKDPKDKSPLPLGPHNNRQTPDADFRRCFQLEDDFSFHARQKQSWKIESVDLATNRFSATLQQEGKPVGPPKSFDLLTSTRVLKGTGFGELKSLAPGQTALFNLTWATLYGPGRVLEIWLDEPSRQLATAHQLERHRNHIRQRGLPGWVQAVDDEKQLVTITFFGGVDATLFNELTHTNPVPLGWPFSKAEANLNAPKGGIAVACESLLTYDPVNDRKGGNILDIKKIPVEPGSSGVQITVQCGMLLEGYRPRRIVRFYPATWKVIGLPREEEFIGRD